MNIEFVCGFTVLG